MSRRILASTVAIVLVALTLFGVPLAYLLDRVVDDAARARLQRQVDAIALAVDPGIGAGHLPTTDDLARLTPRGDRVVVRFGGARAETGRRRGGETLAATATTTAGATVRLETLARPFEDRVRWSVLVLLAMGGIGPRLPPEEDGARHRHVQQHDGPLSRSDADRSLHVRAQLRSGRSASGRRT